MPSAKRVLLVDDDAILRASLAEQLVREGPYVVVEAATAAEAREAAKDGLYALAIMDQNLPDGAGDALSRELKAQGFDTPVLLLSEPGSPPPVAEHIEKPFRFADLLAKLNLYLSRHAANDDLPVIIGPYLFRPGAKLLTQGARKVRLTEQETDILKSRPPAGLPVTRQTSLQEGWVYPHALTTHTLEARISGLR